MKVERRLCFFHIPGEREMSAESTTVPPKVSCHRKLRHLSTGLCSCKANYWLLCDFGSDVGLGKEEVRPVAFKIHGPSAPDVDAMV